MKNLLPLLAILVATSGSAAIPTPQRDALIAIYNATGGPSWNNRAGWLGSAGTECSWFGIRCNDAQTSVTEITLEQNELSGTIPPAFGSFPDLLVLALYENRFTGSIPKELGNLANLETLILDRNQLTGPIPADLGRLTKLKYFNADGNRLGGPLPRELGNLTAVEEIDLSYNQITGAIPGELGQLANLSVLEITQNQLSGTIPRELGSLRKLTQLGLTENSLTGTIPPELGSIATLVSLRLGYNQLEGPIPASLTSLRNLEELDLGANKLSGPLPASLAQLTTLKKLELTKNQLEGAIPLALLGMTSLEELYLGVNRLSGPIPSAISGLTSLQRLSLYGNKFTGTIPASLGLLTKLQSLELQQNELEGPIPPELAQLKQLTGIDLAANNLTGTIPSGFGSFPNLRYLSVYENQLEGPIPSELGALAELDTLYLTSNQLTGTIPDTLQNLKKLTAFYLGGNRLEGVIPSWIGDLSELGVIYFPGNRFSGSIPTSIGRLQKLTSLYLGSNELTGTIPRELGNVRRLGYLSLESTQIGGAIPDEFWTLDQLVEVRLNDMALTGPLPPAVGNLKKSDVFLLGGNNLEGSIPAEIGDMASLLYLSLGRNRFTGTLPPELGKLKTLLQIDLSSNALRGPVSPAIMGMTALIDKQSAFSYNALFATDAATRDFINLKENYEFERTQTVTPGNLRVSATTDRSATIEWSPILYNDDPGGYQVSATAVSGGAPRVIVTTSSKRESSLIVRGLEPSTTYTFTVATVTHPHDIQANLIVSDFSPAVSGATSARVLAPPDVVVTDSASGLVQIDGVAANEDSFTLTNFGDVATSISFNRDPAFFTLSPETFTLEAGASQKVVVGAPPQPLATYYGYAQPIGPGTNQDELVYLTLLSIGKPAGTVRAEPLVTRIEVAGAPGSDSVGSARFRNVGTARLSGIVISDQPWVVPSTDAVTIEPNEIGLVNFRIVRSKRPEGLEGALTANLSLVYVDGSSGLLRFGTLDTGTSGVSVSLVTVVDTSRPAVAPGSVPSIGSGEIAFFATGISNLVRGSQRIVSDISISNAASARSISDLRLYFTPLSASQTSVASVGTIAAVQSVSLANVVGSVYGSEGSVGALQFRTASWQNIAAQARLVNTGSTGTFTGEIPIFRSDRSASAGQQVSLAGVRKSASSHSDLYLQETAGGASTARVDFLDANGVAAAVARSISLAPFGMAELLDVVPAAAVTVTVTNQGTGRVNAYARVTDDATGDTWSVVDWSRINRLALSEGVRVPFVDGGAALSPGRRRRAVRHNSIESNATRSTTDLTLFNPSENEVSANVQLVDATGRATERNLRVGARQTITLSDAGSQSSTPSAYALVTVPRGEVVISARSTATAGGRGTAVPVVAATTGLRLGQSQRFSSLDDSSADAVAAGRAGTFRTALGLVESGGAAVTVRARMYIDDGRSLVRAIIYRDFTLAAGQQVVSDNLVRTIIGNARESLGELNNLQVQIEVVEGRGAVVPFLIVTDNGTGDTHLRMD